MSGNLQLFNVYALCIIKNHQNIILLLYTQLLQNVRMFILFIFWFISYNKNNFHIFILSFFFYIIRSELFANSIYLLFNLTSNF